MKSGQIFMTAMKKTGLIYGRESYSENNSNKKTLAFFVQKYYYSYRKHICPRETDRKDISGIIPRQTDIE